MYYNRECSLLSLRCAFAVFFRTVRCSVEIKGKHCFAAKTNTRADQTVRAAVSRTVYRRFASRRKHFDMLFSGKNYST